MMKVVPFVAVIAMLSIAPAAFASPAAGSSSKAVPLVCPVTGETIPSIKDAAGHSVYKGKTYYFCCPGCKPLFDKNPAAYIKTAPKKSK